MSKQGNISFINPSTLSGFSTAVRGNMTMQAGISPSTASIVVTDGTTIPDTGDLTFSYTDGGADDVSIVWRDCRILKETLRKDRGSFLVTIQIVDRRWLWQFGEISGEYNIRLKDGSVDPATEKTPQELARLLFDAMNEDPVGEDFEPDATRLPNNSRPYVRWDRANPAQELDTLCRDLGCLICLQLDNTVRIFPIETGDPLPIGAVIQKQFGVIRKLVPSQIKLVGAPTEWQVRFSLEAVGLDEDDEIKPLADLAYSVDTSEIVSFIDIANLDHRRRAIQSCYRWYRIKEILGDGEVFDLALPVIGDVLDSADQIHLLTGQIQEETVYGIRKDRKKPVITGEFHSEDPMDRNARGEYTGNFSIDTKRNLVRFSRPIVKSDTEAGDIAVAAELYLECAFTAVDSTRKVYRHERTAAVSTGFVTQPKIIRRDGPSEVIRTIRAEYDESIPGDLTGYVDNLADADAESDYYLDADVATYSSSNDDAGQFAGLVAISIDGNIRSVHWSIGQGPTITSASADENSNPYIPSYEDKQRWQRERAQVQINREVKQDMIRAIELRDKALFG